MTRGLKPDPSIPTSHIPPTAGAYRPTVSLSSDELKEIADRTERWLRGDLADATDYIQRTAMMIFQVNAAIALRDVGGRMGVTQRVTAGRQWFEMATEILTMVRGVRKEAGLSTLDVPGGIVPAGEGLPKPPTHPRIRKQKK
jgi:hypothetical protein